MIRLGVIGSNFISDRVISASRLEGRVCVTALYSRTQERGEEYAGRWDIPSVFTSLDQMLASDTVDAVYVASPNSCHCAQTVACLRAGKHVLCEKPLASNASEARVMIEAARLAGRVLLEAMKPTLTPAWGAVRDALPRVGRVRRWFAAFGKYSSRYDALKGGGLPNAFNPGLSNGAAMDIGVYAIYPMVELFGRPSGVSASVVVLPSGVDGHGAVNFEYEGGMLATVLYSKIADISLPWEIEGEDGTIRGDAINSISRVEFRPRGGEWEEIIESGEWRVESEVSEGFSKIRLGAQREAEGGLKVPAGADRLSCQPREAGAGNVRPTGVASGSSAFLKIPERKHTPSEVLDYVHELSHFVDLIEGGELESPVNSHDTSLAVLEIVDEVRRQAGVVYPADR